MEPYCGSDGEFWFFPLDNTRPRGRTAARRPNDVAAKLRAAVEKAVVEESPSPMGSESDPILDQIGIRNQGVRFRKVGLWMAEIGWP